MKQFLAPYLVDLLTLLIQIVLLFVFFWLHQLKKKAEGYLASKELQLLAKEAFAFAETVFTHLKGQEKYNQALQYLEREAAAKGIPLTAEKARGVIEKAWNEAQNVSGDTTIVEPLVTFSGDEAAADKFLDKLKQQSRATGI